MSNNMAELNEILFNTMRGLTKQELKGEELQEAIEKAKAVEGLGKTILTNARLALDSKKFEAEYLGRSKVEMPKMLGE